jgi:hypothetical protein
MTDDYPDMPADEAEWRCHWAFYKLTVAQRDAAWREIEHLRRLVEAPGSEE